MFKFYVSLAVAVMGFAEACGSRHPLALGDRLFGAYLVWSLFWGMPAFWNFCARHGLNPLRGGGEGFGEQVVRFLLAAAFILAVGYFASVLGLGIAACWLHLARWHRAHPDL